MTAPRPEAVELATALNRTPHATVYSIEHVAALIDAALTAAREEQREKDARVCEACGHLRTVEEVARAIREGR